MVGHEVDDNLQPRVMSASHQGLELGNTVGDILGQVGVDVIIIRDGIGAAGMSLDNMFVVTGDTIGRIIRIVSMFYNPGIPYMCGTEVANRAQYSGIDGIQFSRAVTGDRTVDNRCRTVVGEQSRYQLINYRFDVLCHIVVISGIHTGG